MTLEPSENDVLLGRGRGAQEHPGNCQFIELVRHYKSTYQHAQKRREKTAVAEQILKNIHKRRGRFLETTETCEWREVDAERALSKIKQALRERQKEGGDTDSTKPENLNDTFVSSNWSAKENYSNQTSSPITYGSSKRPQLGVFSQNTSTCALPTAPSISHPLRAANLLTMAQPKQMQPLHIRQSPLQPSAIAAPIQFQRQSLHSHWAPQHEAHAEEVPNLRKEARIGMLDIVQTRKGPAPMEQPEPIDSCWYKGASLASTFRSLGGVHDAHFNASNEGRHLPAQADAPRNAPFPKEFPRQPYVIKEQVLESMDSSQQRGRRRCGGGSFSKMLHSLDKMQRLHNAHFSVADEEQQKQQRQHEDAHGIPSEYSESLTSQDVAAAEFLFSALTEASACHTIAEDLTVTEEEQHAATADLFGKLCISTPPPWKRMKLSDRKSDGSFLLSDVKRHLERIPVNEKRAWLEARGKARDLEVNDQRLKLFLKRENMDPERAARRFIAYWKEREKWFGADKFTLPMTLDGAMKDDAPAVQAGVFRLLPKQDKSGRQLMQCFALMNNYNGYNTQNMIRAYWYMSEVVAQHPDAAKGVVRLIWMKDASLFDTDLELEWALGHLDENVLPVPIRGTHVFCLPYFVSKFLVPIALAQQPKSTRSRVVFHDVDEEHVVEALSCYGISKDVIPTEMGGMCDYRHSNWIESRRAMEQGRGLIRAAQSNAA